MALNQGKPATNGVGNLEREVCDVERKGLGNVRCERAEMCKINIRIGLALSRVVTRSLAKGRCVPGAHIRQGNIFAHVPEGQKESPEHMNPR